jgi:hypothetical protein
MRWEGLSDDHVHHGDFRLMLIRAGTDEPSSPILPAAVLALLHGFSGSHVSIQE